MRLLEMQQNSHCRFLPGKCHLKIEGIAMDDCYSITFLIIYQFYQVVLLSFNPNRG